MNSVNKRHTYTNTPAAIGPSQREECVGDAKQHQQGEMHARVPFLYSFTNQEEAPPQEGAWKDGGGGHCCPQASMGENESPSPHIAINTYSTNTRQ